MADNELETHLVGRTMEELMEFKATVPAPQRHVDFFKTTWLRSLFADDDSPYKAHPYFARYKKPVPMHNITAITMATPDTIPHCIALILRDEGRYSKLQDDIPNDGKQRPFTAPALPDWCLMVDLGEGLNGMPGIAHGGIMCLLLDEACANAAFMYRLARARMIGASDPMFTVGLSASFLGNVQTPCVILVRAWVVRTEGRKWFVRSQIVDETGAVLAEVESLWLTSKREATL